VAFLARDLEPGTRPDVRGGVADPEFVLPGVDRQALALVEEGQLCRAEFDFDPRSLARFEEDALETAQLLDRARQGWVPVVAVELHHFVAGAVADVLDALYDALREQDWERARQLRNIRLPYQRLREVTGADNALPGAMSVPVVEKGPELAGLNGGAVREPIRPLGDAELDDNIERLIG
jgi:hypothetical protein